MTTLNDLRLENTKELNNLKCVRAEQAVLDYRYAYRGEDNIALDIMGQALQLEEDAINARLVVIAVEINTRWPILRP